MEELFDGGDMSMPFPPPVCVNPAWNIPVDEPSSLDKIVDVMAFFVDQYKRVLRDAERMEATLNANAQQRVQDTDDMASIVASHEPAKQVAQQPQVRQSGPPYPFKVSAPFVDFQPQ